MWFVCLETQRVDVRSNLLEKIGKHLKQQRLDLGFTLEAMSQKTKISLPQLREIENGNLDFFANDITYLPFMVKAYARALYVDLKDLPSDVDQLVDVYYHTQELKLSEKFDQIHESIDSKTRSKRPHHHQVRSEIKKQKFEFSQLTLILIVLFIIISIIILTISFVLPLFKKEGGTNTTPPITGLPDKPDDEDPTQPNIPDDVIEQALEITQVSPTEYAISNYGAEQEITLSMEFNARTWIRVYINDVATDNPVSKIYKPDEKIEVIIKAKPNDKVMFHVGVVRSNVFRVDTEVVTLDESIANLNSGAKINFVFAGD